MPSLTTTYLNTPYLQVPRVLPHRRRSRSRSRGRSPEAAVDFLRQSSSPPPTTKANEMLRKTQYIHQATSPPRYRTNGMTRSGSLKRKTSNHHIHRTSVSPMQRTHSMRSRDGDLHGDIYTLTPSPSPEPRTPALRERLVGTWRLESYISYPTPNSPVKRPTYPMTKNVTGLIMYTPDGYMSAHMLMPGQASFSRGQADEAQWAEAGKRCFCYAGPYYITNEGEGREEVLRHTFQVCNLPGWVGDVQIRTWKFEDDGDVLVLGSEEPTEIKGDYRIPVLKWRRMRDNSSGGPPPPMPQIRISGPGEP